MGLSYRLLFIFALCLNLWPLCGAKAHVCRNAVGSREVLFHPETTLEIVATETFHNKISQLLRASFPKTVPVTKKWALAGLSDMMKDRSFIAKWVHKFHFENLKIDSELTKFHHALLPGADPLSVRIQIHMEFQNIKIHVEKPRWELMGFHIPLDGILRWKSVRPDSQEIKLEILAQFNEAGEMQVSSKDFPQLAEALAQEWNLRLSKWSSLIPLRLNEVSLAKEGDFSLGIKTQTPLKHQNQKCVITCENYDFAIALNQRGLNDFVAQAFKNSFVQKHLKKSLKGLLIEQAPLVLIEDQKIPGTLPLSVQLKLKVTPQHPLWTLVKEDFIIHLHLQLQARLGPGGKSLQFQLQNIQPQALHFSEKQFRLPLRLLAGLTPDFIKQTLHSSLVSFANHQMSLHLQPIKFDSWPGFPPMEMVALGVDPVQRHPYLAFRLKTNRVD
jgi:hypothetical protein